MAGKSNNYYTPEELKTLMRVYPIAGKHGVHELLPHRSLLSIQVRASKLGLQSGSSHMQPTRKQEFTSALISSNPHVSPVSIATAISKRERNGEPLGKNGRIPVAEAKYEKMYHSRAREGFGSHWTQSDLDRLESIMQNGGAIEDGVAAFAPHRTHESVLAQARRMGLLKQQENSWWNSLEIEQLRAHLAQGGDLNGAMALFPHRSRLSIKTKIRRIRAA